MSPKSPIDHISNSNGSDERPGAPEMTETIGITYVPLSENSTLRRIVGQAELQMIQRTLEQNNWNRRRAAAQLKISYRGLLYKIRRYGLTPPDALQRASSEVQLCDQPRPMKEL